MKFKEFYKLVFVGMFVFSCETYPVKTVHHSTEESTANTNKPIAVVAPPAPTTNTTTINEKLTEEELAKYSYEIGLDPKKGLTPEEMKRVQQRKQVRTLERSLDSQKERYNYSKVLPWLLNDEEKVTYLSIPTIEGRQAWINKNKIWKRSKNTKEYQDIMETMDIAIGMPTDFVKKAWGEPDLIEHSGNPIYKNERWKYIKQVSTPNGYHQEKRFVFFEGGRVVGWETE